MALYTAVYDGRYINDGLQRLQNQGKSFQYLSHPPSVFPFHLHDVPIVIGPARSSGEVTPKAERRTSNSSSIICHTFPNMENDLQGIMELTRPS